MTVLAFDTSLGALSVAVAAGNPVQITGRLERRQKGHAEALLPMISAALEERAITPAAITRIAVTHGPGGFTSVRIAIAASRGLAMACNADTVSTSSLHLMALDAVERLGPAVKAAPGLLVAEDARRGEVYIQQFGEKGSPLGPVTLTGLARIDEFITADGTIVVGGGAELVATAARVYRVETALPNIVPDARQLAHIAPLLEPAAKIRPLYLRPPDARPQTPPKSTHAAVSRV